jgi:DNA recombination protein RmuC
LAAVLSSLQMGFRTLVIEKRSSEVWQVLGGIKSEFSKFGSALERVQKKLQEASNTMDRAAVRSRAVERKLREVQEPSKILSAGVPAEAEGPAQEDGDALIEPEAAA